MATVYLIMDNRALVDPDEAGIYSVADTLAEAKNLLDDVDDHVIVAADEDGNKLVNLRVVALDGDGHGKAAG